MCRGTSATCNNLVFNKGAIFLKNFEQSTEFLSKENSEEDELQISSVYILEFLIFKNQLYTYRSPRNSQSFLSRFCRFHLAQVHYLLQYCCI